MIIIKITSNFSIMQWLEFSNYACNLNNINHSIYNEINL